MSSFYENSPSDTHDEYILLKACYNPIIKLIKRKGKCRDRRWPWQNTPPGHQSVTSALPPVGFDFPSSCLEGTSQASHWLQAEKELLPQSQSNYLSFPSPFGRQGLPPSLSHQPAWQEQPGPPVLFLGYRTEVTHSYSTEKSGASPHQKTSRSKQNPLFWAQAHSHLANLLLKGSYIRNAWSVCLPACRTAFNYLL